MIVKFIKNKGGGSAKASIDYLLGKDRDRAYAQVLSGHAELTAQLADSLPFKNKYTVGVLSFQENDLSEEHKYAIMKSFEETLMAGLERHQYDITWIEHRDKERLELNFIIPKVELSTGKAFNPYFDRVDRGLVDAWKNVINYDYKLHDPNDPANRQSLTHYKDLPKDKRAFSQELTAYLEQIIINEDIHNRDDVIKVIEGLGLEIARTTATSISIKDPDGGRNIRLKGEIYEQTFQYHADYQRENTAKSECYRAEADERIRTLRAELSSRVRAKRAFNVERYAGARAESEQSLYERHDDGNVGHHHSDIEPTDHGIVMEKPAVVHGIRGNQSEYRTDTDPSQSISESAGDGERWQTVYYQQDEQSGGMAEYRQTESDGVKIDESIFTTLQCVNARLRATSERTSTYSRATAQAHRAVDERKQVAVGAVEYRTRTDETITRVSREIEQRERQTAEINCAVREAEQALGQGVER